MKKKRLVRPNPFICVFYALYLESWMTTTKVLFLRKTHFNRKNNPCKKKLKDRTHCNLTEKYWQHQLSVLQVLCHIEIYHLYLCSRQPGNSSSKMIIKCVAHTEKMINFHGRIAIVVSKQRNVIKSQGCINFLFLYFNNLFLPN